MEYPCISLWQPWATLIEIGAKNIETRGWKPPSKYVGQTIGIHAAKRPVRLSDVNYDISTALAETARDRCVDCKCNGVMESAKCRDYLKHLPLGCVIATARLAAVGQVIGFSTDDRHARLEMLAVAGGFKLPDGSYVTALTPKITYVKIDMYGDFSEGRYLWFLDDIKRLPEPVEAKGRQRFFRVDLM